MEQFLTQAVALAEQLISLIGRHLFLVFGMSAIISAVILVFANSAVHSVLAFLACMLSVAACYLVLQAEFLAVAQMLIYAGGIVVLFLFVVMLVELSKFKEARIFQKQAPFAAAAVLAGLAGFMWLFRQFIFGPSAAVALTLKPELAEGLDVASQNAQAISRGMFTGFLLPFETMSVALLLALVGAIVLAKRERV